MHHYLYIILSAIFCFFIPGFSIENQGKIAFLFMAYDDVYHQDYWTDFFNGHEGKYSNYLYSKSGETKGSLLNNTVIEVDVPTTWANTMRMQIEMLAEALKDPLNQKFVFISDTTIPFCSFEKIYQSFMYTPLSIFPFCKNPHLDPMRSGTFWHYHNFQPKKIFSPIPPELQYKNPQWVVLNRKHAQMMVEDEKTIRIFDNFICDNEHYPSTFLAIEGLLQEEVLNRQTTYDDWIATADPARPFTFTDLKDEYQLKLAVKAIEGNLYSQIHLYYFGRKFSPDCDLTPLDPYLEYRKVSIKN